MKKALILLLSFFIITGHARAEVTQVISGNTGTETLRTSGGSNPYFLGFWGVEGERWTTSEREIQVAANGTLQNLRISLGTAPGSSQSRTFTVMLNNSTTSLTCVVSDTNTSCSDTLHTVTVAAGDDVAIRSTFSTAAPAATTAQWSLEFVSDNSQESIYGYATDTSYHYTSTYYSPLMGTDGNTGTTEANAHTIIPTSGTFSDLYVELETAPTGTMDVTVRKNGSSQTLTCRVSGTETTCNDTSHSFTVSAGDIVNFMLVPASIGTNGGYNIGVKFTADTDGEFILSTPKIAVQTAASGYHILAGDSSYSTTEASVSGVSGAFTAKKIYVSLSAAPGSGDSYTFTLRKSTGDTDLNCTVSGTATTCTETADAAVSAGDILSILQEYSGSPDASNATAGILGYNTPTTTAERRVIFIQ